MFKHFVFINEYLIFKCYAFTLAKILISKRIPTIPCCKSSLGMEGMKMYMLHRINCIVP